MTDEAYSNIREILGSLIGQRLVDVTQHDKEHFEDTGEGFVMLMFEDGQTLKFDAPFWLNEGANDEEET